MNVIWHVDIVCPVVLTLPDIFAIKEADCFEVHIRHIVHDLFVCLVLDVLVLAKIYAVLSEGLLDGAFDLVSIIDVIRMIFGILMRGCRIVESHIRAIVLIILAVQ